MTQAPTEEVTLEGLVARFDALEEATVGTLREFIAQLIEAYRQRLTTIEGQLEQERQARVQAIGEIGTRVENLEALLNHLLGGLPEQDRAGLLARLAALNRAHPGQGDTLTGRH